MELKVGKTFKVQYQTFVLIVPLWNWKIKKQSDTVIKASSNRTFMELKDSKQGRERQRIKVLIVPLWNWKVVGLAVLMMEDLF